VVAQIETGAPTGDENVNTMLAADPSGGVWISLPTARELAWIDPSTNRIARRVAVGEVTAGVAVTRAAIWVVAPSKDKLLRLDLMSGGLVAAIDVDGPYFLAADEHSVWVSSSAGLVRVDPATNAVIATLGSNSGVSRYDPAGQIDDLVVSGSIWVSGANTTVTRIDSMTGQVVAILDLLPRSPSDPNYGNRIALDAGDNAIWAMVTTQAESTLFKIDPLTNRIIATLQLGAMRDLTYGDGVLWLSSIGDNIVVRVNPSASPTPTSTDPTALATPSLPLSGETVATISIGRDPAWDIAADESGVWVSVSELAVSGFVDSGVAFINRDTNRVARRTEVGILPAGIAAGHGSVWVAMMDDSGREQQGALVRIDSATKQLTANIALPGDITSDPAYVATDDTAVWVADLATRAVWRIEPASNTVTATIEIPANADGLAVGGGAVWVGLLGSGDGEIARLDPATNQVVGTIVTDRQGGPIAYAEGSLWVRSSDADGGNLLVRLDPTSGARLAAIPVPGDLVDIVALDGSLWVVSSNVSQSSGSTHDDWQNALLRIDPATNQIAGMQPLEATPAAMATDGNALWIAARTPTTNVVLRVAPSD
jgi:DNA-binding beta-propeller fold protein YncE